MIKRQLVFNGLLTRGTSAEISAAADDSRIVGKFAAANARVAADLWSNVKQATSSCCKSDELGNSARNASTVVFGKLVDGWLTAVS
ncbi:hypothetical protein [Bradyrhizobium sp. CCGE-LA001]|uniref:hypothetical protein n=1 Tax=Bradyrhizobium sp. CCGE-LA001 TaxID=1223566 RepID=UPI0002AA8A31|nr:hypothetical protein [Bradyrhizobium sp. CCGE-LA001]AMA55866.1 hypothetical protein BCCGELA001_06020 [Bradyrhizobium sp. CCGE-LA001]